MENEYYYGTIDGFYKRTLLKRSLRTLDQVWQDVRKMPLIKKYPSDNEKRRLISYCNMFDISIPQNSIKDIDLDIFFELRGKIMKELLKWIDTFKPERKFESAMGYIEDFLAEEKMSKK